MPVGISGDDDDYSPRSRLSSFEKRISCSYPFSPFADGLPRLSFSYHKLPPHLIRLSVVKLDGSSFGMPFYCSIFTFIFVRFVYVIVVTGCSDFSV